MITIVMLLVSLVIFFVMLKKDIPSFQKDELWVSNTKFWKNLGIFVVLSIASFVQPFKLERVDAGHVGIQVKLTGDNRGISSYEYKTGWLVINKWASKLYEFPTYQQHIDYDQQDIITKGGFSTSIKPSFNYNIKPNAVGDMFQNLRRSLKEIEKEWLGNAIISSVNDVANKWNVDDIFNRREQFEADIVREVNKRTSAWFIISQLRTNIVPPKEISEAIIAKTRAIQEVQVAENQKLVAVADGQRKVAVAQADSASAVIAAAGRAEAIRREQISLTPLYIDYIKIQKWDGVQPTVVSGGGGLLIQVPTK